MSTARSREGRPDPGHFCTHVPALRHSEDGAQVTPGLPGGGTGNGLLARSPRLQRHEAGWPRWAWSPGASASRGGRLYKGPGIPRPPEPPIRAEPGLSQTLEPRPAREGTVRLRTAPGAAPPRRPAASPPAPGPHITHSPCPDVTLGPSEAGAPEPTGGSGDTRGHKTLLREAGTCPVDLN